ncbi:hypothetical protein ABZ814_13535 [Micromonospora musae]|uniref:hypothetical protein n=1 Tax=Micromonospora musae TaxID=1894970 RepID=UPI0033E7101B
MAAVIFGLFLMLTGSAPAPAPPTTPTQSWRPATDAEQREHDKQRLLEEMDRLREQHQR